MGWICANKCSMELITRQWETQEESKFEVHSCKFHLRCLRTSSFHFSNAKFKIFQDKIKELRLYLPFVSKKKKKNNSISKLITMILSKTYSYIIVCCLFLLFVIINGSIVVGDKTAHPAVFHPMQNLYFLSFAAFFGFPFFLTQVSYQDKSK